MLKGIPSSVNISGTTSPRIAQASSGPPVVSAGHDRCQKMHVKVGRRPLISQGIDTGNHEMDKLMRSVPYGKWGLDLCMSEGIHFRK